MIELENAVSVARLQRGAEETLGRLNAESRPILLTRRGRPAAVLVDLDTFARLQRSARAEEAYMSRFD